jgi:hypothetical protein
VIEAELVLSELEGLLVPELRAQLWSRRRSRG